MSEAKYVMPHVERGDVVLWVPDKGVDPQGELAGPAVVVSVGYNSVTLSVLHPNFRALCPQEGVHHINDPQVVNRPQASTGFWVHTPRTLRLMKLISELDGPGKDDA